MLIPSPALETPNYDIQRIRKDETISSESSASYQMAKAAPEPETSQSLQADQPGPEVPAVTSVKPAAPAPTPAPAPAPASPDTAKVASKPGLLKRLFASLFGSGEQPKEPEAVKPAQQRGQQNRSQRGNADRNRNRRKQPQGNRRPANRPAGGQAGAQRTAAKKTTTNQEQKKKAPEQAAASPETTQAEAGQQAQKEGTSQQKRGARRGRRGGRRRSSGQNRNASNQNTAAGDNNAQAKPDADGNKQPSTPPVDTRRQDDASNKGTQSAKQENRPVTAPADKPVVTGTAPAAPQTKPAVPAATSPQAVTNKPADGNQAGGSAKTETSTAKKGGLTENRPAKPVTDKPADKETRQAAPQTKPVAPAAAAAPQAVANKPADTNQAGGAAKTETTTVKKVASE